MENIRGQVVAALWAVHLFLGEVWLPLEQGRNGVLPIEHFHRRGHAIFHEFPTVFGLEPGFQV